MFFSDARLAALKAWETGGGELALRGRAIRKWGDESVAALAIFRAGLRGRCSQAKLEHSGHLGSCT